MERVMGIEPTALAWEARVLPLYDTRAALFLARLHGLRKALDSLDFLSGQVAPLAEG